jgi:hypothetical protein
MMRAYQIRERFYNLAKENDDSIPCYKFDSNPVSNEEIFEATQALQTKTSSDLNGLSISFIEKFIDSLVTSLHHSIQFSPSHGPVAIKLKIAKVISIFKSGDR